MSKLAIACVAAFLLCGCSTTKYEFHEAATTAPESKIAFVQHRGIYSWQAVNDSRLYVQDAGRQWYQVDLLGPCTGLEFADRVRFMPSDPAGDFDRFSWIQMRGQRCKVQSVKKVEPPTRFVKSSAGARAG